MQNTNLTCTYNGHNKSNINGVCVNKCCDKLRPVCLICTKQYHNQHVGDLLDNSEFNEWRKEGLQFQDQLKSIIKELEQVVQTLRELIPMKSIERKVNLQCATTVIISSEVEIVLQMKSYGLLLSKDLSQLNEQIQFIQKKYKALKTQKQGQIEGAFAPQQQMKQISLVNYAKIPQQSPPIQQQVQAKQQTVVQVVQKPEFKFSEFKLEKIMVEQLGNLAVCPKGKLFYGSSRFFVCEPTIPNDCITRVSFKIIKCTQDIFIGVCQRYMIKSANYQPNLNDIGHGCYLICNDGCSFSHHQQEMNNKEQQFSFDTNDIIIVEIGNQKITWINQQQNQTLFTMQFNLQGDLSYCVSFWNNNTDEQVVEIVDEI